MTDKLKYILEGKRRQKLRKDLADKYDNIEDVKKILTDSLYSELTGIYVPDIANEKATSRYYTKKNNDIALINEMITPHVIIKREAMSLSDILTR